MLYHLFTANSHSLFYSTMSVLQCICIFCAYLTPISSLSANFTRPFGNDVATTNPIIRTTGSSSRIRCGLDCNQEPDCLGYNLREACVTGDCCQLTRGITRLVDTVNAPGMVYYAKKCKCLGENIYVFNRVYFH